MHSILLIGTATLDIINFVNHYPEEDSEIRASKQISRSGGNAANTAIVLQQLELQTHLVTNLADDNNASLIAKQLNVRGINLELCPIMVNSVTPTSYIIASTLNASRSIVHYRKLPELLATDFTKVDLSSFDWLHFEARNCQQLKIMLDHAKLSNKIISIELEKNRDDLELIIHYADLLFISKPFALSQGLNSAEQCIEHYAQRFPSKTITCTWGDSGAWAYHKKETLFQPAYKINRMTETLGAGDTFNAAFIAARLEKQSLQNTLQYACKLASIKCQQLGFDDLVHHSQTP